MQFFFRTCSISRYFFYILIVENGQKLKDLLILFHCLYFIGNDSLKLFFIAFAKNLSTDALSNKAIIIALKDHSEILSLKFQKL